MEAKSPSGKTYKGRRYVPEQVCHTFRRLYQKKFSGYRKDFAVLVRRDFISIMVERTAFLRLLSFLNYVLMPVNLFLFLLF